MHYITNKQRVHFSLFTLTTTTNQGTTHEIYFLSSPKTHLIWYQYHPILQYKILLLIHKSDMSTILRNVFVKTTIFRRNFHTNFHCVMFLGNKVIVLFLCKCEILPLSSSSTNGQRVCNCLEYFVCFNFFRIQIICAIVLWNWISSTAPL